MRLMQIYECDGEFYKKFLLLFAEHGIFGTGSRVHGTSMASAAEVDLLWKY
jgi:hypothetical protein